MNPLLQERYFPQQNAEEMLSIRGVVHKSLILALILFMSAAYAFSQPLSESSSFLMIGLIGSIISFIAIIVKKHLAKFFAPLYAFFEGLLLGAISLTYANAYGPIIFQAVLLTLSVLFSMLIIYQSGMIKVTDKFRLGVFAATGGIALLYFLSMILSIFGMPMSFIHSNGLVGIGFSVFVIIIAAMNLIMDFDFIEKMKGKSPKYMEWFAGFTLMVTLVWLYLEILRLLSKLNSRR